jgi:hypothetical protein
VLSALPDPKRKIIVSNDRKYKLEAITQSAGAMQERKSKMTRNPPGPATVTQVPGSLPNPLSPVEG